MVQLATVATLLGLWTLVCTQSISRPSWSGLVEKQRIDWQEQIDKVKEAEEKLKQKHFNQGTVNLEHKNDNELIEEKNEIKVQPTFYEEISLKGSEDVKNDELIKQTTTPKTRKPVSTYQKNKSSYLLEAERFLKEFRQRKFTQSNKIHTRPKVKEDKQDYVRERFSPKTRKSSYLERANDILKNIKDPKKSPIEKTTVLSTIKTHELDQTKVQNILIENTKTKEGLKEIIKKLLKAKLANLELNLKS